MKTHHFIMHLLLLITFILLAGCGTAPPAVPTATAVPDSGEPENTQIPDTATHTPPAPTAESQPEIYPPPVTAVPERSTREPGYPPPATFPPTVDPYPGGMVWILRPVGVQCEEGTTPGYGDLRESVATLAAAGLQVEDSEMVALMVPTACGSPTSEHFRIKIHVDELDTAQSMGWTRE